ncbi:MAG: hypothetical protein R3234_12370 [Thermoanaerobaculia bacterium]|nr:hypothetical protein [Thermoanaerobaculia bacterium]
MSWTLLFIVVVGVAAVLFLVRHMRGLVQEEEERKETWRELASRHGLEARRAEGPEPVREIDGAWLKKAFSRRVSRSVPGGGQLVLEGTFEGFTLVVDSVAVRKWWTDSQDFYTRIIVEVPGAPEEIDLRSVGWLSWLPGSARTGHRAFDKAFRVLGPEEVVRSYLTPSRRMALLGARDAADRIELVQGRLYGIQRGLWSDAVDLERTLARMVDLARVLQVSGAA